MSVIQNGEKIVLQRSGADEFWNLIRERYAAEDPRKWKYLAILALRENAGWPLECIGRAFGHPKGHITRCLVNIKSELRDRFDLDQDWIDSPDIEPEERIRPFDAAA
jgi:hypothetical protein